jgi:hypothetical protein
MIDKLNWNMMTLSQRHDDIQCHYVYLYKYNNYESLNIYTHIVRIRGYLPIINKLAYTEMLWHIHEDRIKYSMPIIFCAKTQIRYKY